MLKTKWSRGLAVVCLLLLSFLILMWVETGSIIKAIIYTFGAMTFSSTILFLINWINKGE